MSVAKFNVNPWAKPRAPQANWLKCDPELKAQIVATIDAEFERIVAAEGLSAIEQPKSAACAHEAGHAVVGTVLGDAVTRVEIWRERKVERRIGIPNWGGHTYYNNSSWTIAPDTPVYAMRDRIRRLVAGQAAEAVLDPAGYRNGTSLDERVVSQVIAADLHEREGSTGHPRETWDACWYWALATIKHNEVAGRELIAKLDKIGSIQGKPLRSILRRIAPITVETVKTAVMMTKTPGVVGGAS